MCRNEPIIVIMIIIMIIIMIVIYMYIRLKGNNTNRYIFLIV